MNGEGLKSERETVIRWDEDSDQATIWTASETVYRRLMKRLGRAHLAEDGERHAIFRVPRRWVILPKFKRPRENKNPFLKKSLDTTTAS